MDIKDEKQFQNHIKDLAKRSYDQGIITFTDFCGLAEQSVILSMEKEISYAHIEKFGGSDTSERVIFKFGNPEELGFDIPYPISVVRVAPLNCRFADRLSHRDFLGALMNLGIKRDTLGDIFVNNEDGKTLEAYIFCLDSMAEFINKNLTSIKHTAVSTTIVSDMKDVKKDPPECINVQAASARIDAVVAKVYNKSRNECIEFFRERKVFVDGRLVENNDRTLKSGEWVNVRGLGKFAIVGEMGMTKKGKLSINVEVFR